MPGIPLSYTGLLVLRLTFPQPFGTSFLIIRALVVIVLLVPLVLDNIIPA